MHQKLKQQKKMVIQCCGRKSCINVVLKKKPNSTITTTLNKTHKTIQSTTLVMKQAISEKQTSTGLEEGSAAPSTLEVSTEQIETKPNPTSEKVSTDPFTATERSIITETAEESISSSGDQPQEVKISSVLSSEGTKVPETHSSLTSSQTLKTDSESSLISSTSIISILPSSILSTSTTASTKEETTTFLANSAAASTPKTEIPTTPTSSSPKTEITTSRISTTTTTTSSTTKTTTTPTTGTTTRQKIMKPTTATTKIPLV